MPVTKNDLDRFHLFAAQMIDNGGRNLTLEQIVQEWQAVTERSEVNAAIREGLADIDAGNFRPLDEFVDEFRQRKGISQNP